MASIGVINVTIRHKIENRSMRSRSDQMVNKVLTIFWLYFIAYYGMVNLLGTSHFKYKSH